MSQLIQMRRRIATIETIHKITNAMRLIAMSGHTRLKHREELILNYKKQIEELYQQIRTQIPADYDPMAKHIAPDAAELIIVVGSQKGLCGGFNTHLFKLFDEYTQKSGKADLIAIGKRATDHILNKNYGNVIMSQSSFNTSNIHSTVSIISQIISQPEARYSKITVLSNALKTFFSQRPIIYKLLPLESATTHTPAEKGTLFEGYLWEQTPQSIVNDLAYLYLEATLHALLFQSLLAEQAARFLSMDNATRNAENLLGSYKIQYNKLRQAKITKEINELVSSISGN
jgi:F-type H+-transporting ATPase subunit gamma